MEDHGNARSVALPEGDEFPDLLKALITVSTISSRVSKARHKSVSV